MLKRLNVNIAKGVISLFYDSREPLEIEEIVKSDKSYAIVKINVVGYIAELVKGV